MSPRLSTSTVRDASSCISVAVAAFLVVYPMLGTTFLGDDTFNSYVDGWIAYHHSTLYGAIVQSIYDWDLTHGRFIPLLQVLNVVQFHLFHEPLPLKVFQAVAIAADVATLYLALRSFGMSTLRATVGCAIAVLTLQIRFAYDPITQYNLHLPLSTEAALLAIVFFARYARSQRLADLVWALVAYTCATLMYEVFMPLAFAFPIVTWQSGASARKQWTAWLPLVLIICEGAVAIVVRFVVPQTAYAPSFSSDVFGTWLRQVVGTLPFTYVIFDPRAIFSATGPQWLLAATPPAIGAALAMLFALSMARDTASRPPNRGAFAVGVALLLGPGVFIALSPLYRGSVDFGTPYIPVFAQGFGLAFGVAALPLSQLGASVVRAVRVVAPFVVAFGVYVTATANSVTVPHFDYWKSARTTIVQGLSNGAAAKFRDGDTLFLDRSYVVNSRTNSLWQREAFYRQWTGRNLKVTANALERASTVNGIAYDLRSFRNTPTTGILIVAKLSAEKEPLHVVDAVIFERFPAKHEMMHRPEGVLDGFPASDFTTLRTGPDFTTYAFRPRCAALSPDALSTGVPTRLDLTFGRGFDIEESDNNDRWRWAGPMATIEVHNPTSRSVAAEFETVVGTTGRALGHVTLRAPNKETDIALTPLGKHVVLPIVVPAHGMVPLSFLASGPNAALAGDSRDLRFRLVDAALRDSGTCKRSTN